MEHTETEAKGYLKQEDLDQALKTKDYKELVSLYEAACEDERAIYEAYGHKDYYTDTCTKRRYLIEQLLEFSQAGTEFNMSCELQSGLIVINDKFIVAPRASKWRVKGKAKWYRYSRNRPWEFIEKYVLRN